MSGALAYKVLLIRGLITVVNWGGTNVHTLAQVWDFGQHRGERKNEDLTKVTWPRTQLAEAGMDHQSSTGIWGSQAPETTTQRKGTRGHA